MHAQEVALCHPAQHCLWPPCLMRWPDAGRRPRTADAASGRAAAFRAIGLLYWRGTVIVNPSRGRRPVLAPRLEVGSGSKQLPLINATAEPPRTTGGQASCACQVPEGGVRNRSTQPSWCSVKLSSRPRANRYDLTCLDQTFPIVPVQKKCKSGGQTNHEPCATWCFVYPEPARKSTSIRNRNIEKNWNCTKTHSKSDVLLNSSVARGINLK
ncbi:hypothetical protein DFH27DRAFT_374978 [Peziza echinospora]|nr:hypothetical protein DFH27DRAFT_374978 [Peziza echinospora]